MTEVLQVSTVAATREAALKLAQSAVEAGLAAGGQVSGPVMSFFWHEGKYGEGEEWTVSLKTTKKRYRELEAHLLEQHDWTNPEISAIALADASSSYVDWIERVTSQAQTSGTGL